MLAQEAPNSRASPTSFLKSSRTPPSSPLRDAPSSEGPGRVMVDSTEPRCVMMTLRSRVFGTSLQPISEQVPVQACWMHQGKATTSGACQELEGVVSVVS